MLPSQREETHGIPPHTPRGEGGRMKRVIPDGLTHKRLEASRAISKHPGGDEGNEGKPSL